MAIGLSDAHTELAQVARRFLESHKTHDAARVLLDATDETLPPFWDALCELGWLGLHLPEAGPDMDSPSC